MSRRMRERPSEWQRRSRQLARASAAGDEAGVSRAYRDLIVAWGRGRGFVPAVPRDADGRPLDEGEADE